MRKLSIIAATLVVLAACSSGLPHRGGVLGSHSPDVPSDVTATVNYVDTTSQRIDVSVGTINGMASSSSAASIYYDNNTVVNYLGRTFRPFDLQRGDQITVHGFNNNGRYTADTITVTRNANASR